MRTSEQLDQIAPALLAAQQEFANPKKDTKGHHYKYATLDQVIDCVVPVLNTHGIMLTQNHVASEPGTVGLSTTLIHESGQFIESTMTIPMEGNKSMSACQQYGSASTYARRYAIQSAAGLCAEADDDAAPQRVNNKQINQMKPLFDQLTDDLKDRFLAKYNLKGLPDLRADHFDEAIDLLNQGIAYMKANSEEAKEAA